MKDSRAEPPQRCWFCEINEATEPYVRAGITELVCAACLKRLMVRAALEDRLIDIMTMESSRRYDDALACLDAILEANRHLDDDQWLARSIAMHRCSILVDAGRFAEAEAACKAWADLGFSTVDARWMHGFKFAQTLDALGRPREALDAIEDALSEEDPKYLPSARGLLRQLAELSEKLGQPVEPKWRLLAERFAKCYRVELPKADTLGKAILELVRTTRALKPKSPEEWKTNEGKDDP